MATANDQITDDMFRPADIDTSENEKVSRESVSVLRESLHRFFKNKGAVASLIVLVLLIFMAIFGPYFNHYGATAQDLNRSNLPPKVTALSWLPLFSGQEAGVDSYQQHNVKENFWFGTDQLGRDLWSRTWDGTRVSLIIALVASLVDVFIGVTYGGISGYFGGMTDNIMQRIIEIISGIPQLVWIILLILVLKPGLVAIIIALTIANWVSMARVVRGEMLKFKNQEFVLASITLGASHARLIFKHLIPNAMAMIIVNTMFSIPNAIFFEAFLSFIGLGLSDPQTSLGSLINAGYQTLQLHPYQTVFPGLVICLLLISFNLIGNGLRDAFDPRLRS
ncbi:MAG: ABC transporter permease [Sporolactobacillus sp.]|jgi:oligopeptide transport system permease protein|nr:ABC transporter permease [Sporolactobacillus sp.]MCI1882811.1 ABC transporter permease [Sporolactobacillus sp.]